MAGMDIALQIEGQNGLNWPRWQRIVQAAEDLGFAGVYRSDHFTNADPPDIDSLELWTSLTWLASHTSRIDFGPLVSPLSFRDPRQTARMAAAVDDLSGGRLVLGLGAGWNQREHDLWGYDLLEVPERFTRFIEGLEVITRLLRSDEPVTFLGQYYCLDGAVLLPRPRQPGGPSILIGGNGERRSLPVAARYGDEWNAYSQTPSEFARKCNLLDRLLLENSRQPGDVRRSMMTNIIFGGTQVEVNAKVSRRTQDPRGAEALREQGVIVGVAEEVSLQMRELEQAGVQRIILQWLDLDDIAGLEALASEVLPQFGA